MPHLIAQEVPLKAVKHVLNKELIRRMKNILPDTPMNMWRIMFYFNPIKGDRIVRIIVREATAFEHVLHFTAHKNSLVQINAALESTGGTKGIIALETVVDAFKEVFHKQIQQEIRDIDSWAPVIDIVEAVRFLPNTENVPYQHLAQ
jgi:hypothetical protein